MKFTTLLVLVSLSGALFGQAFDDQGCTGAVGDVKYSVLSPQDFENENGDCWIFMDGSAMSSSNRLFTYTGWTHIPDARGFFIRSLDTRTSSRVDVDRSGSEEPGHVQYHQIKAHRHGLAPQVVAAFGNAIPGANGGDGAATLLSRTAFEGGNETRPSNIILYTYIRID